MSWCNLTLGSGWRTQRRAAITFDDYAQQMLTAGDYVGDKMAELPAAPGGAHGRPTGTPFPLDYRSCNNTCLCDDTCHTPS